MADWNGFKKNGTTYIPNDATARASISVIEGKIPSAASSSNKLVDTTTMTTELNGKVNVSSVGANNGVAGLDANGRVPSSQLPSYVDDVLEYASQSAFPATGETGKIYIALDTNKTYRWSGSAYVEISESLALGETSSTAYAGNKGKANADAISAMKDGSSIDSFGDVETALEGKVDKITGKSLSTNDYNNTAKGIVDNIQSNVIANTKLIKDTVGWSGKNKFNYIAFKPVTVTGGTAVFENNGITLTATSNDCHTANNTSSGYPADAVIPVKEGEPIALVWKSTETDYKGDVYLFPNGDTSRLINIGNHKERIDYTPISGDSFITIRFGVNTSGNTVHYKNIMAVDADTLDLSYEPYFGSTAFPRSEQAVLGAKNFLKYPYFHTTRTQNNVTFTDNGDGSITIETTDAGASGNTAFIMMNESACKSYFSDFIGRTFKISGGTSSVEVGEQSLQVEGVGNYSTGDDLEVTVRNDLANAGSDLAIKLLVRSGKKITTPITVRPMLSFDGGKYVPYAMTNKELTDAVTLKDVTSDIIRNTEQTAYSISSLFVYKIGRLVTVIGDISSLTENAVPSGRAFITIATGLPKALKNSNIFAMPIGSGNQAQVYVEGNSSDMKMRGGTTGQSYQFVFTYISAS